MSISKRSLIALLLLAVPLFAQSPSPLPAQAKPVAGILVPVPKEIFRSLDQFRNVNWRAVQRPEVIHWKSHGDQVQIATLLGVVVAEGFIAMKAEDSSEVQNLGGSVLTLARGLGVEETAVRRSRSIIDLADHNEWPRARKEWDAVLSDLERGMIALKSEALSQLVSLSGWLRGTEAICVLVLQNYSAQRAEIIRQPAMLDHLEKQLVAMPPAIRNRLVVMKMLNGIQQIHALIQNENKPLTENTVRQIRSICRELVTAASQRST